MDQNGEKPVVLAAPVPACSGGGLVTKQTSLATTEECKL
jgi:hypothetical protein